MLIRLNLCTDSSEHQTSKSAKIDAIPCEFYSIEYSVFRWALYIVWFVCAVAQLLLTPQRQRHFSIWSDALHFCKRQQLIPIFQKLSPLLHQWLNGDRRIFHQFNNPNETHVFDSIMRLRWFIAVFTFVLAKLFAWTVLFNAISSFVRHGLNWCFAFFPFIFLSWCCLFFTFPLMCNDERHIDRFNGVVNPFWLAINDIEHSKQRKKHDNQMKMTVTNICIWAVARANRKWIKSNMWTALSKREYMFVTHALQCFIF